MTEILAVFRSRSQAIDAAAKLKKAGIAASVISTPREAGVGCGLSVKFYETFLPRAGQILSHRGYSSFGGFLAARNYGGKKIYKRI